PAALAVQQPRRVRAGRGAAPGRDHRRGWYLTSGRYTSVPAVGKLTAQEATRTLHQAGFQVRTGPSVINDDVPKGEVISTSPSGKALPGATIVLTVSQGPRMITV